VFRTQRDVMPPGQAPKVQDWSLLPANVNLENRLFWRGRVADEMCPPVRKFIERMESLTAAPATTSPGDLGDGDLSLLNDYRLPTALMAVCGIVKIR
jgi:hypothetical protein